MSQNNKTRASAADRDAKTTRHTIQRGQVVCLVFWLVIAVVAVSRHQSSRFAPLSTLLHIYADIEQYIYNSSR